MSQARAWDGAMVARIESGDDSALAAVYDRYGAVVHGIAGRLVGRDRADDVTQDVFLHLWQHPSAYDPAQSGLRCWLALIARRRAIDALRTTERRSAREHRAGAAYPAAEPTVEDTALAGLASDRVRAAIAALPPEQRRAIELAYFAGLTFRDVAARTGAAEGTTKSRLRLGLGRLERALAADLDVVEGSAWN